MCICTHSYLGTGSASINPLCLIIRSTGSRGKNEKRTADGRMLAQCQHCGCWEILPLQQISDQLHSFFYRMLFRVWIQETEHEIVSKSIWAFNMSEKSSLYQTGNICINTYFNGRNESHLCPCTPPKIQLQQDASLGVKGQTVRVVLDDISKMKNILFTSVSLIWLK